MKTNLCNFFLSVTVTTARKAVTIVLSFLFFSKNFTFSYVWSGLIVVLGIYLNVYSKKSKLTATDLKNMFIDLIRRPGKSDRERKGLLNVWKKQSFVQYSYQFQLLSNFIKFSHFKICISKYFKINVNIYKIHYYMGRFPHQKPD